jgi:His-Xaa-Ser system protein HxsD
MRAVLEQIKPGEFCIKASREIYKKQAILATAYHFSAQAEFFVDVTDDDFYVHLISDDSSAEVIAREFCSELIDQQLRIEINNRCGNIRDLIVRHAFAPIENLNEEIRVEET